MELFIELSNYSTAEQGLNILLWSISVIGRSYLWYCDSSLIKTQKKKEKEEEEEKETDDLAVSSVSHSFHVHENYLKVEK